MFYLIILKNFNENSIKIKTLLNLGYVKSLDFLLIVKNRKIYKILKNY